MHVDLTYSEEANIANKTTNETGGEDEDISNFSFRATAGFEQRVSMDAIAGAGVSFYLPSNANQKYSGALTYTGENKRTVQDGKRRPVSEEESKISFNGVLSDDSVLGVPDDNAAAIQFGIQANLNGGCKGKRTSTMYLAGPGGEEEKKVEPSEINACANSDETHVAAIITRHPIGLEARPTADGNEAMHYAAQFHVISCNLNPPSCADLKASEAAADDVPNGAAMSENWIGATTTGTIAEGFKINLTMFKELKVDGKWKRSLQVAASVTPVTKSQSHLQSLPSRNVETADRLRGPFKV